MKIFQSINIDKNSEEPMYIQLFEEIKSLIENNTLTSDSKLPPIRRLADQLEVNNVTVVNAYKLLEQKGFVYSKIGSGTYVRGLKKVHSQMNRNHVADMMEQGYVKMHHDEVNFSTSTPNPELFPVKEFKEVLNEVLDRDGGFAFGYQESQGYFPLRESIRDYLEEDGINTDLNHVHVISGAQQGIDIVSKALIEFNDTIVVESPTYTGALAVFKSRGANIVEVPIMKDGIDTRELEEVLKTFKPKLIYVMTSFQNPTGISYSEDKKLQLLYLAQKYNAFILEDDYLSELKFHGEKSLPIKALDGNNKVIYLKSFSKIFMPGIRLAFLVTPEITSKDVLSAKHTTDISTSSFMQRAFDLYLRKKMWQKHIDMMYGIYRERYDLLVKELREKAPFVKFSEPLGGIHIWAETDIDSSILGSAAKQNGLLIAPGRVFYSDNRQTNYFRISFAGAEISKISEGVKLLNSSYLNIKDIGGSNVLPFM